MKIGCDACGLAEAAVLCCADEAALCRSCDAAVHSANKLAGRHHRVALLPSGAAAACDICQEKTGYFFCLEDRALLCRPCDVAVHSGAGAAHVSPHRRFLVTGVRVGGFESDRIVVAGKDDTPSSGVVISPSSGGGGSRSSVPSSGNPTIMAAGDMPSPSAVKQGFEQQQQWPWWSEFLAEPEEDVCIGMEQCCPAGLSEESG